MMPKLRISWPEKDAVFGNTSLAPTTALGTGDLANQRHNAAQHQHTVQSSHLPASPGRKTTCPSRTVALFPQPGDDRRPTTSRSCSSALPSFRGQLRLSVDSGPSVFEQTGVTLGTCRMWMMPWSTTSLNRGVGQNGGLESADVVAGLAAGATPNVTVTVKVNSARHGHHETASVFKTALAVLAGLLSGASAAANLVQHERVPQLPQGWARMDASLDPDQPFRLSIALRQPEIHRLASKFAPGSGHLSLDEVRTLRAPDPKDAAAVVDWLRENGVHDTVTKDDWIHVNTTVSTAESLLNTQLQRYSFDGKVSMVRAREYSVPSHLSDAISFINPISNFMTPLREPMTPLPALDARDRRAGAAACSGTVTPKCLRQLYNMHYQAPGNSSQVRLGVSGYLEEHSNHADVRDFLRQQVPELPRYDFKVELVNGGTDPQNRLTAGGEAQLDLEYVMGLGFPSQVTYYATGGRGEKIGDDGKPVTGKKLDNEPYLEFIQALLDKPDNEVPHVLSVSYGDDELSVPRPYAERVCGMLGLLTKRGTSIIHSTGDGGSAGGRVGNCRTKDGTNKKVTMSTFPASCPWVTAVGATTNTAEPPSGAGFSSGGFSQYFERPAWQAAAVDKYVKEINGHLDGYYNASMRAVPDISAVGTNFRVIVGARRKLLEGTSASAPVFAAMISLVNDARLRKGKPSLGWLNEILYSDKVTSLLQDITQGQSYSCTWDKVSPGGWPAKQGWDAITGLGVPNDFAKFLEVLEDV